MLQDLKVLNGAFIPVLDYTVSYKPELGLCLQRMIESYNLLLLDQFKAYYRNESLKANDLKERQAQLNQQAQEVAQGKKELNA